jgi:broad specificity phosphatase PhoE
MADPDEYPAPWHLEGPWPDGNWGHDIAIVAADGTCVVHRWATESWKHAAKRIVDAVNEVARESGDGARAGRAQNALE